MAGGGAQPASQTEPAAAPAADPERAAFEPERAFPEPPAAFEADDFFEREIGILSEQGNFERARVQLSRRVAAHGDDAQLYLDAIRMERSAARGGEAWQAWLVRALSAGVQIGGHVHGLVSADELRECLVRRDIGFSVLERQRDPAALRELLRLRWERLLERDPKLTLACMEEPALQRAAEHDPALRRLALGVLAGAVFSNPERVAGIAPRYGLTLASSDAAARTPARGSRAPDALLEQAYRLRAAWRELVEQSECPPPFERFARLGRLLSVTQTDRLLLALGADLRARPREYLRCADAIARRSPALWQWIGDTVRAARPARHAGAPPSARDASEQDAIDRPLQAAGDAARRDRLGRLWQVALVLSVTACGLAAFAAASAGPRYLTGVLAVWTPLLLVLWPLHRRVDALRYVRSVRSVLLDLVAQRGLALDELAGRMLHAPNWTLRRLARHAAADRALMLLSRIAASGDRAAER